MNIMGWHKSDLASVVSTLESGSRPKGGVSTETGEVASLGGENILQSGGVTLADVKRVPHAFFEQMTKGHLANGDILINKDGAQTGKVGIYLADGVGLACINEHLFLIRGNTQQIRQDFLYYTLLSELGQRQIAAQISGSAQPGLKSSFLKGIVAVIPDSLSEQAKIAETLSTVDRTIEQTEALIAKQKRIKTGLMRNLLTRGVDERGNLRSDHTHAFKDSPVGRIPVEWGFSRIESVGRWASGGTPSKANPNYWGDEVPWLCPKDMKTFDIDSTIDLLTQAGVRYGSALMPEKTVFIVVRGMILAHTFPVCIASRPMAFNQDVKGIAAGPAVEPRFLAYWLVSQAENFLKLTTTATHGTKRFDMNEVFDVVMPIPEKDEQTRVVTRLDAAEEQVVSNRKIVRKLRSLKTGLMQDLLIGRRRVTALLEPGPKREKIYARH
jgi:type I restriction enzyme S subunit